MKYLLDTNICIYIIKKKPPQVIHHLHSLPISNICLSSITVAELEYGVEKSQKVEQNRLALVEFLAPLEILPFDETAAIRYGKVRHRLEQSGMAIGSMDMMIAAHALSLDLILVTNNSREFQRVQGLKTENWV